MNQQLGLKMEILNGKSILITGGTGTFGRAFAKKLINESKCHKVIIFSRDEWKQWEMQHSEPAFSDTRMRYFLGDVRDEKRLVRAFNEIDIVIHAAALKQVPAAEYNPTEFIKTNVVGGMNVVDAAITAGVKKVIALSTDKAVNPINLYGATKLCSDKLFVAGNSYVGARGFPVFSVIRYGNVAGSRGSIIPHWRKILNQTEGPLPVTDERMTRFWITVQEAVDFVLKCLPLMRGGEIFVPKIPSFKITDLAIAMGKGRPCTSIGIREGEKLHELMIGMDDARHTLDFEDHYVIVPEAYTHSKDLLQKFLNGRKGVTPAEGFSYTSDKNTQWLKPDELAQRAQELAADRNL